MATPAEIAGYVGAAAWAPQIGQWLYARFVPPKVTILAEKRAQLGFTTFGCIFNVRLAMSTDRKDTILDAIEVTLRHQDGDEHQLAWAGHRETFSEITDNQGNRQVVERDQPAIALKLSTQLLTEKFVLFQEPSYHERHNPAFGIADAHLAHLRRGNAATGSSSFFASKEYSTLTDFYSSALWWRAGRYTVAFLIRSPKAVKLERAAYSFQLSQLDVDRLRGNLSLIDSDYRNRVLAGTEGYQVVPINWAWPNVTLAKEVAA